MYIVYKKGDGKCVIEKLKWEVFVGRDIDLEVIKFWLKLRWVISEFKDRRVR